MQGKNVLVTGASGGMGQAVTRLVYQKGATVITVARNQEKLRALAEELGERVLVYPADLSELESVQGLFDFCKKNNLKLDGIVHCAGAAMTCPLRANSIEKTEYLMRVNFESLVEICRFAASKRYTNEDASIVALSSTASLCGDKGLAVYSASKASVNTFVKSAAMELVSRRIRINAIAPAMVRTPMYYHTIEEIPSMESVIENTQPFGLIEADAIAELAEFLLSEKSRYITGSIIVVGAGHVF